MCTYCINRTSIFSERIHLIISNFSSLGHTSPIDEKQVDSLSEINSLFYLPRHIKGETITNN